MSFKRTAKKMSHAASILDLGPRTGFWLRAVYPGSRAKSVARDFNVSEGTAKRWLSGERPTSEHLSAMAVKFGWRFVSFVFEPAIGTPAMFVDLAVREAAVGDMRAAREAEDARVDMAGAREASAPLGAPSCVAWQDETPTHSIVPIASSTGAE